MILMSSKVMHMYCQVCVCIYIYTHICVCMYTYIQMRIHRYAHIYMCICTYLHECTWEPEAPESYGDLEPRQGEPRPKGTLSWGLLGTTWMIGRLSQSTWP